MTKKRKFEHVDEDKKAVTKVGGEKRAKLEAKGVASVKVEKKHEVKAEKKGDDEGKPTGDEKDAVKPEGAPDIEVSA